MHVGGTLEDIAASEAAVGRGEHPERPFLILAQQSLFDPTRAPAGKHTAWTYCHTPNGSTEDMTHRIEAQIERFAPGFRSRILARATRNAVEMERYNPNYIGGDINGGVQDLGQLFTRPVPSLDPTRRRPRGSTSAHLPRPGRRRPWHVRLFRGPVGTQGERCEFNCSEVNAAGSSSFMA